MNRYRVSVIASALAIVLSGCSALQDIDYSRQEDYAFKVKEVKLQELLEKDELLRKRNEELNLIKEKEASKKASKAELSENWSVIAPSLNIRANASTDAETLGTLTLGDTVVQKGEQVDQDGEKWIFFEMENGAVGYVAAKYLSKSVADQPIGVYRVVIHNLNVRSEPNEESQILGELTYFTDFSAFEKVTDANGKIWLKTQAPGSDSGYGYVMSDFTVVVSE